MHALSVGYCLIFWLASCTFLNHHLRSASALGDLKRAAITIIIRLLILRCYAITFLLIDFYIEQPLRGQANRHSMHAARHLKSAAIIAATIIGFIVMTNLTAARSPLLAVTMLLNLTTSSLAVTITGGEGPDNITGTVANDTIDGRDGDDKIYGIGGDDQIKSGGGNDIVWGGSGDDTIQGNAAAGDGVDYLYGEDGNDIFNSSDAGYVRGGAGDDTFNQTNYFAYGEGGNDVFFVSDPWNGEINGGPGNDTINAYILGWSQYYMNGQIPAGKRPGKLLGGDDDDIVKVTPGQCLPIDDILFDGGLGVDTLWISNNPNPTGYSPGCHDYALNSRNFERLVINWSVDWTNDGYFPGVPSDDFISPGITFTIDVNGTDAKIDWSAESDSGLALRGHFGIDPMGNPSDVPSQVSLIGGALADSVLMDAGMPRSDVFKGNGGNDQFNGGDGIDTAIYSGKAADYTLTEVTYNSFTVQDNRPGSPDGTDTIADVNKLQFADKTVDVVIRGLNIVGDAANNQLSGTAYADRIEGLAGIDTLNGNAGNDQLIGGTGADKMTGGSGNDEYAFDNISDTAIEASGGGIDTVNSSVSIGFLSSYVEKLNLTGTGALNGTGNGLNNTITGNAGANVLSGGLGNDKLIGGLGDDTYYGNTSGVLGTDIDTVSFEDRTAAVTFNLALSTVQVTGGAGNDRVPNGSIENLIGGSAGDRLYGTSGANRIEGKAGNDFINGGAGADTLIGNGGLDVINCGAETTNNADTVSYLALSDSVVGANRDQVLNFKAGDKINLTAIDANTTLSGNQAFIFNTTTPRANSVWYVVSGASVVVRGDVNGNTTPDFEILMKDRAGLLSTDFAL